MHVLSWVTWFFVSHMGAVGAANSDTSGVVEVDLIFPRNDTYAPAPYVPIVFAVQNPELASLLKLEIEFQVLNATNGSIVDQGMFSDSYDTGDFNRTNMSSPADPALLYRHYDGLSTEGKWILLWTVYWSNCTYDSNRRETSLTSHTQNSPITFTTKKNAQDIDLVDATKDRNCPGDQGIAFNITDTAEVTGGYVDGERCAVLENSTVTPTPCRVKIDSTTTSSISAALTASLCSDQYQMLVEAGRIPESEISCPADKSAAHQLLVGGITFLMAAVGALSYLLL